MNGTTGKKARNIQILFLAVMLAVLAAACEKKSSAEHEVVYEANKIEAEDVLQTERPESPVLLSPNIRKGAEWNTVRDEIDLLNKTATEIHEITEYYCFADESEAFLAIDGRIYLGFSDNVFAKGSKCVSLGIPTDWLVNSGNYEKELSIDNIAAQFGFAPEYYDNGEDRYYRYCFEDLEIIIYVKNDEKTLYDDSDMDKYTLIRLHNAEPVTTSGKNAYKRAINPKDARLRPEWETVNGYIDKLGKSLDETEVILGYALDSHENLSKEIYYFDTFTKVGYWFDESGHCSNIWMDSETIFPNRNQMITKEELHSYWRDVAYIWGSYESKYYVYAFEDAVIMIDPSSDEGDIYDDSTVYIKAVR
jgi:hypothetical protein